jgi:hypothetical protein
MKKLWEAFSKELGSSFKTQYGNTEGETFFYWEKQLKKFTKAEIQKGFLKYKTADSTFLSVKMFRPLCEPDHLDLGLPGLNEAFKALIMGEWQNMPEAFRVLFASHRYELRQLSDTESRKRFKPIYDDAVRRIAQGEQIKMQKHVQIENPSGVVHSKKYNGPKGSEAIEVMLGWFKS